MTRKDKTMTRKDKMISHIMTFNYGLDDPKNDETNLSYLKTLKTCELEDMCDPEHAPFYGDKELAFALAMSELLYNMRRESDFLVGDDEGIAEEYIDKILADETHVKAAKERIRMSVLEAVTEFPKTFNRNSKGEYKYSPDTYDHAYCLDMYIENQYNIDNPVLIKTWCCDTCGGENVRSRVWVLPNKRFQLADELLSEDVNDGYCDDCESNVTISFKQKPLQ